MSVLKMVHLLLAIGVIALPYVDLPYLDLFTQDQADQLKPLAPYAAGTIGVNVFFPQIVRAVKHVGRAVSQLCSRAFDKMLGFIVLRIDRIRSRRDSGEQRTDVANSANSAKNPGAGAAEPPAGHEDAPGSSGSDAGVE